MGQILFPKLLARLPGAFVLMPQELRQLSREECEERLSLEVGWWPVSHQKTDGLNAWKAEPYKQEMSS